MGADPSPSHALFVTGAGLSQGDRRPWPTLRRSCGIHVAWRCVKEWDNRWRGYSHSAHVNSRALYQFAMEKAEHNRATSSYLGTLATRPSNPAVGDDFNRQVAIWVRTMRSLMFVNSAAINADVGTCSTRRPTLLLPALSRPRSARWWSQLLEPLALSQRHLDQRLPLSVHGQQAGHAGGERGDQQWLGGWRVRAAS